MWFSRKILFLLLLSSLWCLKFVTTHPDDRTRIATSLAGLGGISTLSIFAMYLLAVNELDRVKAECYTKLTQCEYARKQLEAGSSTCDQATVEQNQLKNNAIGICVKFGAAKQADCITCAQITTQASCTAPKCEWKSIGAGNGCVVV